MKKIAWAFIIIPFCCMCTGKNVTVSNNNGFIMDNTVKETINLLLNKQGNSQQERIENGVRMAASFWTEKDGNAEDFVTFCTNKFIADTAELDRVFKRISSHLEIINGNFNAITVGLQRPLQLDIGEILPVDEAFGTFDPATHFSDDFFANKIAFIIALNFPSWSLTEKSDRAEKWTRKEWAYARLGDVFVSRVPANVNQQVVNAVNGSDMYIADYNIYAGKLVNQEGKSLFPEDMKLLSHWNLRDEIKSNYGNPAGLEKQKLLYEVMKRIVSQEIPATVINSSKVSWNPYTNKVTDGNTNLDASPEASVRYQKLLDFFHAQQEVDKFYPHLNTYIQRSFEADMEIPLKDAEELFKTYLSSPEVKQVAAVIKKRLGRNLEPFDIWYDGFKSRTAIPADKLNQLTRQKYPNAQAVQEDLPKILTNLGFSNQRSNELTAKILVEPARGSGHAWGAESRDQKSLLRTRIFTNGMDYKGYNIAVHEFGHNVEQTITLQNVDYYMLRGVPNTAFTEALAFMFQKNDLKLLGMTELGEMQQHLNNLDVAWSLFEIMGVSLVDIETWKWLYANPTADKEQLKQAVNDIAIRIWNDYYAPVFDIRDQNILGIYSHMINAPLYLPNYAYGHIIEFQLAEYIKDKNFADEIERIFRQGRLTPQFWMQKATGNRITVQPILNATKSAITKVDGGI